MNWMIDGAYGDLYRRAMGFPELGEAQDEWEIERSSGRKSRTVRDPFTGPARRFATSLAHAIETIRVAITSKETVS